MQNRKVISFYIVTILLSLILIIVDINIEYKTGERIFRLYKSNLRSYLNSRRRCSELEERNKELIQRIAELNYKKQLYQILKKENQRLENILDFKSYREDSVIPCRIINKLPEAVNISYLVSKGERHGIKENQPVIGFKGVFGKILKVNETNAVVQSITNYNMAISVRNVRSGTQGVVKWHRDFIMDGIPLYADIEQGDTIVTTGLGSVFPEGLPVGVIEQISRNESSYKQIIKIRAFEDFRNPYVVFVIK